MASVWWRKWWGSLHCQGGQVRFESLSSFQLASAKPTRLQNQDQQHESLHALESGHSSWKRTPCRGVCTKNPLSIKLFVLQHKNWLFSKLLFDRFLRCFETYGYIYISESVLRFFITMVIYLSQLFWSFRAMVQFDELGWLL